MRWLGKNGSLKEFFGKTMKGIITQLKMIELSILDTLFLFLMTLLVIGLINCGISVLTFGGIVLIFGAFLTYKGQIYLSVATYIISDLCWIYNAFENNDLVGVTFISVGIFFGILATFKMKNGHMEKDLITRKVKTSKVNKK
jgi:hypothetical protein